MSDFLNEFENKIYLSDKAIFTKIWTQPRLVFKYINDHYYSKFMILLLVLSGIASAIDQAINKNSGDTMSLLGVLSLTIIVGALFGWISYYFLSALLYWTGKWVDGQGSINPILNMLAHASIPKILGILLVIPQIGAYGLDLFKSNINETNATIFANVIVFGTAIVQLGLGIWTMVLGVIGLSEVQKISIGKSLLNYLFAFLVVIVPVLLIILVLHM